MADKLTDYLQGSSRNSSEPKAGSPSVFSRREAFMLDFEFANGQRFALPYTSLRSLKLDPSAMLIALFSNHVVTITGVNLLTVYEGLSTRAVGTLKEMNARPAKYPDGVPVIYSIEITEAEE